MFTSNINMITTPEIMKLISSCLLLVLFVSHSAQALQCYWCSHNAVDSSNDILGFFLKKISTISNEHCRLDNELAKYNVDVRTCPPPSPGHVAKCGEVKGTVTADVLSVTSVHFETIERDCIEVPEDHEDGCNDEEGASGITQTLLDETFTKLKIGDISFKGSSCFDSKGVTVEGLLCPRCTWNELSTNHGLVEWFLDGLALLKNHHCLLEEPEDLYSIGNRQCKPASLTGEQTKCGEINGKITGNVLNVDYEYKTLQRDCVTVPTSSAVSAVASAYTDGCHTDVPNDGPVADLIKETYGSMDDVKNVEFVGQACYSRAFDYNSVGSASLNTPSYALFTLFLLASCIFLMF